MTRSLGKPLALLILKFSFIRASIFKLYSPAIRLEYKNLSQTTFLELLELLKVERSPYGLIRMGSESDGGYLMANNFSHDDFLLSFGVGTDVSFEHSLSSSIKGIHLYDHTVDGLPTGISNATFFKTGLAVKSGKNMIDLEGAISEIPSSSEVILKIDIEGDEWEILSEVGSELLNRCKQIVIEFHNLESIFSTSKLKLYFSVLKKLRLTHNVINVHGNNWDSFKVIHGQMWANALEITYLRKDFFPDKKATEQLRLNLPNNPNRPDYNLGINL